MTGIGKMGQVTKQEGLVWAQCSNKKCAVFYEVTLEEIEEGVAHKLGEHGIGCHNTRFRICNIDKCLTCNSEFPRDYLADGITEKHMAKNNSICLGPFINIR